MKKLIIIVIIVIVGLFLFTNKAKTPKDKFVSESEGQILYYTCGMHPSVRVAPADYKKGSKNCPICQMALTPVYSAPSRKDKLKPENVISVSQADLARAGIETFKVKILPLFKQIRTVGVVAYDPDLRTAQEEYLQALNTYDKVSESQFEDAKLRSKQVLEAAKTKLKLLGLSKESIDNLKEVGEPDESLILPDDFMWVYADIYEFEAIWPRVGDKAKITSQADPSIILEGQIKSIEPVVKERSRTLRAQIAVENKGNILKPNMYVDVNLRTGLGFSLAIPRNAVLETGKRKIAYVDLGKGSYQPREVIVGPIAQGIMGDHTMDFYPLIDGVREAELVVTKGNFLIDSQSQIGAAASEFGGALAPESSTHQH